MRPERRHRGDIAVAALLALLLVGGAAVLWRTSALAATASRTADPPISAPRAALGVPAGFVEAWRAPSAATPAPVVAGPAVITADGSTVVGRDARTGTEAWNYARNLPLCTIGSGFPDFELGRVLALYERSPGWCSELTALRPDTGERVTARNPDLRPGTRLVGDDTFVVGTGTDLLEVMRSDLVRTLEYGAVTSPVQVGEQPRTGCTYGSTVLARGRLGVIERCPGEVTDRLTVIVPDGADGAEKPEVEFSVPLAAAGATLVALSFDRAAVALPNPARLQILDGAGTQVGFLTLDVPDGDLLGDPPGGVAAVEVGDLQVYWWTGSRTVALDAVDLAPVWTLPGTLGPAVGYADGLLVAVPAGLAEIDPASGTVRRTLPVERADRTGPVRLAAQGEVLLEQRGSEIVALVPVP